VPSGAAREELQYYTGDVINAALDGAGQPGPPMCALSVRRILGDMLAAHGLRR
jgi:hypothetical protein